MSIVIRHGSNGSCKTASAVERYLIPAMKEGRHIITNIRGVTRERCYKFYPELPESFDIEFIDTDTKQGKQLALTWFHWAKPGALLLFDEASSVFPKSLRQNDIDQLDYPGGPDQAKEDGKPESWLVAWEKHRHWSWDVVLTTPNIKGIRDDIRGTTEMAYRHRRLPLPDFLANGRFKECQHDATKNGFTPSDWISMSLEKVKKDTFDLYDSTQTGLVSNGKAGKSLLANPKVIMLLGIIGLCGGLLLDSGGLKTFADADQKVSQQATKPAVDRAQEATTTTGKPATYARRDDRASVRVQKPYVDHDLNPFEGFAITLAGQINTRYLFELTKDNHVLHLDSRQIIDAGFQVKIITHCIAQIYNQTFKTYAYCSQQVSEAASEDSQRSNERGLL